SEEHTSELQSPCNLVCRLLLEKKNPNGSIVLVRAPRIVHEAKEIRRSLQVVLHDDDAIVFAANPGHATDDRIRTPEVPITFDDRNRPEAGDRPDEIAYLPDPRGCRSVARAVTKHEQITFGGKLILL